MFEAIYKAIRTDFPCETLKMNSQAFQRAYRNEIRKQCKKYGLTLLPKCASGWCEASGFITDGKGNYVYFNSGDYRWNNWQIVLWRGCRDEHDYSGFSNQYADLKNFGENISKYFVSRG